MQNIRLGYFRHRANWRSPTSCAAGCLLVIQCYYSCLQMANRMWRGRMRLLPTRLKVKLGGLTFFGAKITLSYFEVTEKAHICIVSSWHILLYVEKEGARPAHQAPQYVCFDLFTQSKNVLFCLRHTLLRSTPSSFHHRHFNTVNEMAAVTPELLSVCLSTLGFV